MLGNIDTNRLKAGDMEESAVGLLHLRPMTGVRLLGLQIEPVRRSNPLVELSAVLLHQTGVCTTFGWTRTVVFEHKHV
jgi:hypothetical protein